MGKRCVQWKLENEMEGLEDDYECCTHRRKQTRCSSPPPASLKHEYQQWKKAYRQSKCATYPQEMPETSIPLRFDAREQDQNDLSKLDKQICEQKKIAQQVEDLLKRRKSANSDRALEQVNRHLVDQLRSMCDEFDKEEKKNYARCSGSNKPTTTKNLSSLVEPLKTDNDEKSTKPTTTKTSTNTNNNTKSKTKPRLKIKPKTIILTQNTSCPKKGVSATAMAYRIFDENIRRQENVRSIMLEKCEHLEYPTVSSSSATAAAASGSKCVTPTYGVNSFNVLPRATSEFSAMLRQESNDIMQNSSLWRTGDMLNLFPNFNRLTHSTKTTENSVIPVSMNARSINSPMCHKSFCANSDEFEYSYPAISTNFNIDTNTGIKTSVDEIVNAAMAAFTQLKLERQKAGMQSNNSPRSRSTENDCPPETDQQQESGECADTCGSCCASTSRGNDTTFNPQFHSTMVQRPCGESNSNSKMRSTNKSRKSKQSEKSMCTQCSSKDGDVTSLFVPAQMLCNSEPDMMQFYKDKRPPVADTISAIKCRLPPKDWQKILFDYFVRDNYCPGMIQDTIDGVVNFNSIMINMMREKIGTIPKDPGPYEPWSLIEAFSLRIDHERCQVRHYTAEGNKDITADIEAHFQRQTPTRLNRAISSLLKAERIHGSNSPPQQDLFEMNVNRADVLLPNKTVQMVLLTGSTTPIN